ncbi:hypothetical protein GLOTRDRAFT_129138 [Gloeophyllum trabeum ATCC 11539]|uniref:NudC domain-containing protein 1 n=1 Tax=Gloeophyllum trabeum (strain ATCC 11539 / FP-39264 / Madison 617) TaxID=670483 RepID=S7RN98_GLOTA|nr:uncharacterized protein GLOTRDRAFT_129138 [Gloeophyllum trabeum ATCC 11539]EPQ55935.1 hypothetical protein GLOTRDRAFT_129138 [Gloeophyllum trabeum ATCC 11539]
MANFRGLTLRHKVDEDVLDPKAPWEPLKSIHSASRPYIITFDSFGAASNVWSIDSGSPTYVTKLEPALPGEILPHRSTVTYAPAHSILAVGYDCPPSLRDDRKDSPAVLRAYSTDSGQLLEVTELSGRLALGTSSIRCSSDYMAVAMGEPAPQIIVFRVGSSGFQEVLRVPSLTQKDIFIPVQLFDRGEDFTLLTSSTSVPSSSLTLALYSRSGDSARTDLTVPEDRADWLEPGATTMLPDGTTVLHVKGTQSSCDHHPDSTRSTVYALAPGLAISWIRRFDSVVKKVTYHPALQAIVVLSSRGKFSDSVDTFIISFLNPVSGEVIREASFRYQPETYLTAQCTLTDELVIVTKAGGLSVLPLQTISDEGFKDKSAEEMLITRASPVQPEPYNTKARKAGDRWGWVDHCIVYSKGVVLIPLRGPGIFVVQW